MAKGDFQDYSDPSKNNFTRHVQNSPVPARVATSLPKVGLGNLPSTPSLISNMDKFKMMINRNLGTSFAPENTTLDSAGNAYYNPADAAKMDINFEGLGGPGVKQPGIFDDITAGGVAQGIGAAANLANAYIGYKNYGLAKDKFGFEKAATNRNIENQAQQYNTELQNRGEIGLALGGASISPEQRANTLAQMERQKISGAAIG